MGNHEYCEDCGESDFHHHRPCNPEKVKARKEAREQGEAKQAIEVKLMSKVLDDLGLEYRIDEFGQAIISHDQFSNEAIAWQLEQKCVMNKCGSKWREPTGWDDTIEYCCVREQNHKGGCRAKSGYKRCKE